MEPVAVVAMVAVFLLPSMVAFTRHLPSWPAVAAVNVLLGWTVIGWLVAVTMACREQPEPD
jgi:hypothetical protein